MQQKVIFVADIHQKCSKCGCIGILIEFPKNKSAKSGFSTVCKSCRRIRIKEHYIKTNGSTYKKYRQSTKGRAVRSKILKKYYNSDHGRYQNKFIKTCSPEQFLKYKLASIRAKKEWPVEIDLEYLINLFTQQNHRCIITKIVMTHDYNDPRAISIDRIDPSIGYLKGNIQLVCRAINMAKQSFSNSEIIKFFGEIKNA